MDAMALYLIGTAVTVTVALTSKDRRLLLHGFCWPAIAFIGIPALIGSLIHRIANTHDNGDPYNPQEVLIFITGWVTIAAMTAS